jgi:hypothetical protein
MRHPCLSNRPPPQRGCQPLATAIIITITISIITPRARSEALEVALAAE